MKIWILVSLVANGTQFPNLYPARIYSSLTLCEQEMKAENDAAAKLGERDSIAYRCISGPLLNHVYDPAKDLDADIDRHSLDSRDLDYLKQRYGQSKKDWRFKPESTARLSNLHSVIRSLKMFP